MNSTPTKELKFYSIGDCLILSEFSPVCRLPFDIDEDRKAVTFYEGDEVHRFTVEGFLKWRSGLTQSRIQPEQVFNPPKGMEPIKSITLRLAVRIDSFKTADGFCAIALTTDSLELARFYGATEKDALQTASKAFMPYKGAEV